ncbi:MAG: hypothetical protein JSR58_03750 [Verrucomicrobia bacterium]|nr:hypothetical protein [Verrucomicrobiota bacterium]
MTTTFITELQRASTDVQNLATQWVEFSKFTLESNTTQEKVESFYEHYYVHLNGLGDNILSQKKLIEAANVMISSWQISSNDLNDLDAISKNFHSFMSGLKMTQASYLSSLERCQQNS